MPFTCSDGFLRRSDIKAASDVVWSTSTLYTCLTCYETRRRPERYDPLVLSSTIASKLDAFVAEVSWAHMLVSSCFVHNTGLESSRAKCTVSSMSPRKAGANLNIVTIMAVLTGLRLSYGFDWKYILWIASPFYNVI
jgi:hypothetical protein